MRRRVGAGSAEHSLLLPRGVAAVITGLRPPHTGQSGPEHPRPWCPERPGGEAGCGSTAKTALAACGAGPVEGDPPAVGRRRRAPLAEALRAVAARRPSARAVRDDGEVEPLHRVAQRRAPARAQRGDPLRHRLRRGPLRVRARRVRDERGPRLVGSRGVRELDRRAQPPPQRLGRRAVGGGAGAVVRLGGEQRLRGGCASACRARGQPVCACACGECMCVVMCVCMCMCMCRHVACVHRVCVRRCEAGTCMAY